MCRVSLSAKAFGYYTCQNYFGLSTQLDFQRKFNYQNLALGANNHYPQMGSVGKTNGPAGNKYDVTCTMIMTTITR